MRNIITIREGKGAKDRVAPLPEKFKTELIAQLEKAQAVHRKYLENGYGETFLPEALDRKYPSARKEWAWQFVFPFSRLAVDPTI